MSRSWLEEQQTWFYVVALILGIGTGLGAPGHGEYLEFLIPPALAVLLYGMFTQIPFLELKAAFANRRFMLALLTLNFVIAPLLVWGLTSLLPQHPPLLLGIYLVLLTPCIDYVIVFTHLGRGDARLVLAATPVLLLVQMLLLPVYLWLFMGPEITGFMSASPLIEAFLMLVILPLGLALATEAWASRQRTGQAWLDAAAWIPVSMMALVLFLVSASQMPRVADHLPQIVLSIPVYIAFLVIMPLLGRWLACAFRLDTGAGRALIFSGGIRNSLVVLPLALALPDEWIIVPAVIVTQTVIELFGALVYVRVIPWLLYPETRRCLNLSTPS